MARGIDDFVSSQSPKVLPVGKPARLRRVCRFARSRPAASSARRNPHDFGRGPSVGLSRSGMISLKDLRIWGSFRRLVRVDRLGQRVAVSAGNSAQRGAHQASSLSSSVVAGLAGAGVWPKVDQAAVPRLQSVVLAATDRISVFVGDLVVEDRDQVPIGEPAGHRRRPQRSVDCVRGVQLRKVHASAIFALMRRARGGSPRPSQLLAPWPNCRKASSAAVRGLGTRSAASRSGRGG